MARFSLPTKVHLRTADIDALRHRASDASLFGKLSPTNGGAIQVYSAALKDTTIMARLLLNDAKMFFEGPLRITKGNFINAPKSQVHGWIRACGRNQADLAGRASHRNSVYAFRFGDVTNLHFTKLNGTSTTRIDSRDSSLEQPKPVSRIRERIRFTQTTYEDADTSRRLHSIERLRESNWTRIPDGPGVYWWYFSKPHLESLEIAHHCVPAGLRLRRANGRLCLYVGITERLRQRIKWHAAQHLTQSALRSGMLSTLRFSLLALARFDYNSGDAEINSLMDELDISWISTRGKPEARSIESSELQGDFHFPLNIQGNHRLETVDFVKYLRSRRKTYRKQHLR